MDTSGTFSFRASRFVDTSVGMAGEGLNDSTLTGDRGILISDDGERRTELLRNITFKKRRIHLRPDKLHDSLAEWIPVLDDDDIGDDLRATLDAISGSTDSGKRKGYTSSDNPISEFKDVQEDMVHELLRLCGLGDSMTNPQCTICHVKLDSTLPAMAPATDSDDHRIFKCPDCGEFIQCKNCCVERHSMMPLHFPKVWNGKFWADTTLKSLGLVYQLGHQGAPCPTPVTMVRSLVVMDTTGIHQVRYRRCGCDRSDTTNPVRQLLRNAWFPATATDPDTCATFKLLELFRLLNVVGNVNGQDFVTCLERSTNTLNSTGMDKVPDRYKAFLRMAREYAFLLRVIRAGRGHDPAGLTATKQGECAVDCWTCPHEGRNLPEGWRDVDPKFGYLYKLILAVDTNFKLKNRMRANERDDPSLGPGWGYFVEPTRYKDHLRKYVAEIDVSTCIAFAALTQKETRNTAGLRVSGVGGCVCARHECVRPNGFGDLQKGERYANMDYIVMSALAGFDLKELTISYDIACQWRKNLLARICKLPADMQLDFEEFLFECGLPVWHASSHEGECAAKNSLSFVPGVGKSDGEGIERLWSELNAFAFHTKTMGLGHRADTLEDKIDHHNFMKNLGQADILRRKLMVAIAERARQVAAWKEVNKSVPSEVRAAWQELIDAFLANKNLPNPYMLSGNDSPTESQIRVALKRDEEEAAAKGTAPLHGTSATAFLTAGLQLEDSQRRIKAQLAGTALVTADRESKLQEHRLALQAKLRPFRVLQHIYTPAVIHAVDREERARNPDAAPVRAENVRLFLPSQLTEAERAGGCQEGLAEMEAKLREAQCGDALVKLRSRLHAKRHVLYWKAGNVGGQHGATRSQTLVGQITDRINATADKYRDARRALHSLKGADHAPHFQELKAANLTLDGDVRDTETAARKRLAMISAGKGARNPRHISGTSRRVMSWIWAADGALDAAEEDLHESLRVEWSRAKARKTRWDEEVHILREEMRRILCYLEWETGAWEARREGVAEAVTPAIRAGMQAYVAKQADIRARLRGFFWTQLNLSLGDAVAASVRDSALEDSDALNTLFTGDAEASIACFGDDTSNCLTTHGAFDADSENLSDSNKKRTEASLGAACTSRRQREGAILLGGGFGTFLPHLGRT
ncbi:hypothetical protein B0H13DRAFT_2386681 [Mycena leptocephala]|nr:hypothetical protein B0H13DRAFT_2386681 [Mycena leptocephala]